MNKKKHVSTTFLALLQALFRWPWVPFQEASSLESFADRGYILFGSFLALSIIVAYQLTDVLLDPISALPELLVAIITTIFKSAKLPAEISLDYPIVYTIAIVYLGIFFSPKLRRKIGDFFVENLFRVVEWLISLGEWCISHRWGSVFLILLLATLLGVGTSYSVRERTDVGVLEKQFENWIGDVENLLRYSPLDGGKRQEFDVVTAEWTDRFSATLSKREFSRARLLADLIDSLHEKRTANTPWLTHLGEKLPLYNNIFKKSHPRDIESESKSLERRVDDLSRVLLGRLYINFARDDCSNMPALIEADQLLTSVSNKLYRPMVANAQGRIYNCFLFHLLSGTELPQAQQEQIKNKCQDLYTCILRALHFYQEATGDEAGNCGFRDKRFRNNDLDLKAKLAIHYDSVAVRQASRGVLREWLRTKKTLANTLESGVSRLLECNSTEPLIPIVFITAAQASGAAATLQDYNTPEQDLNLHAAGVYLRLSHSFRPHDMEDWDMRCFCTALSPDRNALKAKFLQGFQSLQSLREVDTDYLRSRIENACS